MQTMPIPMRRRVVLGICWMRAVCAGCPVITRCALARYEDKVYRDRDSYCLSGFILDSLRGASPLSWHLAHACRLFSVGIIECRRESDIMIKSLDCES
ncbi:hypothetical protein BDV36DRAFT_262594 [Aspergillus pseudocaelatus]|uniref:Secreted protein n=1 Tax=Aspergillus pseudocaelatus TaxID=1825620 RepID=A0ABQ6WEK3_9EURO|nr:hypothetical protein BDV36DRAFT_262594 [Aspergillus pseudocaelatus]